MNVALYRVRRMAILVALAIALVAAASTSLQVYAADAPIADRTVDVDGVRIHYLTAGRGEPLLLLHGYAQSSRMWTRAIPELAKRFTVIAPDLPGFGASAIPRDGLDMKSAAVRVHALAKHLNVTRARVVGHDIGLMVAYAYAATYPTEVEKLVVMDAFLPGIGDWQATYHDPQLWHFIFNGPTAEALVKDRERIYFDHFWNDFAAHPRRSVSEADRAIYTAEYARPGRMRAGWAYFAAIPRTATDFAQLAKTPLTMPVLVIAGEKAAGAGLVRQVRLVARDVTAIILEGTGHWLIDERPAETLQALLRFL
jgi:pimeloyl-ACP methyl ester carboxylesterase